MTDDLTTKYQKRMMTAQTLLAQLVQRLEGAGLERIIDPKVHTFLKGLDIDLDNPDGSKFFFEDLRENMLLWAEDRTFFWLVERKDINGNWLLLGYKWGPNDQPMRGIIYPGENMAKWQPLSEAEAFKHPPFNRWLPWSKLYPEQWAKWTRDPVIQMHHNGGFASALRFYSITLRTEP